MVVHIQIKLKNRVSNVSDVERQISPGSTMSVHSVEVEMVEKGDMTLATIEI